MKKLILVASIGSLVLIIGCGGEPKPIVDDGYANKVRPPRISDKIKKPEPIVNGKYLNKVKPKVPNYSNGKYSKIPINPKI